MSLTKSEGIKDPGLSYQVVVGYYLRSNVFEITKRKYKITYESYVSIFAALIFNKIYIFWFYNKILTVIEEDYLYRIIPNN